VNRSGPAIDKAVILAAGMGKRIASMGDVPPKPLLPLDATGRLTFLDWHLRTLHGLGAREIYLVGSVSTFGVTTTAMDSVPATWILNDFPGGESGSGHSAQLAFTSGHGILDGTSRVLLMDADVVYDPSLVAEFASAVSPRSKTLVCGSFRETDEEVMVFGDDEGVPRMHGKGLLGTPLVRDLRCLGEATGLLLLEPQDHDLWLRAAEWCMTFSTARTRSEHEDITARLLAIGALEAVVFRQGTRWMECDTPEEYEVVRREMVPRWAGTLPA
jgi:choline kinase